MNTGHKERGIVFVSALVMMTMLLATGLGYMVMVRTEINITKNYIDEIKLLTDIESCVERAIGKIANVSNAKQPSITIIQSAVASITADNIAITVDNNIITVDNG